MFRVIKMFVTDIDGTLLPTGGAVSAGNVAAVQAMIAAGVKVVVATGRMYAAALQDCPQQDILPRRPRRSPALHLHN